jgi:hypothetical protein
MGHLEEVVGGAGLFVRADLDLIHQSLWVMPVLQNKNEAEDNHGSTNSPRNAYGDGKRCDSPAFHGRCASCCKCMRRVYHIKQVHRDVLCHGFFFLYSIITQIVKRKKIYASF